MIPKVVQNGVKWMDGVGKGIKFARISTLHLFECSQDDVNQPGHLDLEFPRGSFKPRERR